jgi:adenine-specific DNA-methyltransferase
MPTLHWIGKDKVLKHHHDVPFRVLNHQYTFSSEGESNTKTPLLGVGGLNKIIHGDNLEALKALLPYYEGKIKCIYIDPPYNTGNEDWVYNDNVNDPKIKKWLGKVVGKEAEDLTRHDKWLCMMYPRLKLLHKLLAPDGAIFVSIDDNEQASLKLLMDEIWGGGNFVANVCVVNNFKGRSDAKIIATSHESLLIFAKSKFETNGVLLPDEYLQEYKLIDDVGKYYRLQGLRKRGSGSKREDRPNMYYPFYFDKQSNTISLESTNDNNIEILPKLSDGTDGRWRWGKDTALENIEKLTSQLVKGRNEYDIFQKDYLENDGNLKRVKPKSFWHGSEFSSEAGTLQLKKIFNKTPFDTPKSIDFIEYCLQQATNKDSIILDSFAGSGTTAQAVLNLNKADSGNRKFILVEMEDYAETITAERVKRVINGYGNVEGTGGDFNYYELGEPLFDEDSNLNENLPVAILRDYIWYVETKDSLPTDTNEFHQQTYFLDKYQETAYFFIYEKEHITTLDYDFLEHVNIQAEQYVMYADNCTLSEAFRREKHIIFKKIPRDISRF